MPAWMDNLASFEARNRLKRTMSDYIDCCGALDINYSEVP